MRLREIRRVLRNIVAASLPAGRVLYGCSCPVPPPPTEDTVAIMSPIDAEMQALIDECRAQQRCIELCDEAIRRRDGVAPYDVIDCELVLGGDAGDQPTAVKVTLGPPACGGGGRRLEGLHLPSPGAANAVGHWFATQTQLESAAVHAFLELDVELAALGAPASLCRAARRAAAEEIGHARMSARLAARHGARTIPSPEIGPRAARSLEALAIENAVEGCVGETHNTLVAEWQAANAADPAVREVMAIIARDEARHAAFSWRLDAWIAQRLDDAGRRRVREARFTAVADLTRALAGDPPADLIALAGIPAGPAARSLVARAREALWS